MNLTRCDVHAGTPVGVNCADCRSRRNEYNRAWTRRNRRTGVCVYAWMFGECGGGSDKMFGAFGVWPRGCDRVSEEEASVADMRSRRLL